MVVVVRFHVQVRNNFPNQVMPGRWARSPVAVAHGYFFCHPDKEKRRDLVDLLGSSRNARFPLRLFPEFSQLIFCMVFLQPPQKK